MKFLQRLTGKAPKPTTPIYHEKPVVPSSAPTPPPRRSPDIHSMLSALISLDLGTATRAAEQLYTMALADPKVGRLVAANNLPSVLRLLEAPYPTPKMHGAYLLSALVGCSPMSDAELVRREIAGQLVQSLATSASPGLARGLLRALSKLLSPDFAYHSAFLDQILACGGLTIIAAGLASKELGAVRRSLELLTLACAQQPDEAARQTVAASETLVMLLRCGVVDVQQGSLRVIEAMCGSTEARKALLTWGCGEGLERLMDNSPSVEVRQAANRVLSKLRPALLTFPGQDDGRTAESAPNEESIWRNHQAKSAAPLQTASSHGTVTENAPSVSAQSTGGRSALDQNVADLRAASSRAQLQAADALAALAAQDPQRLLAAGALPSLLEVLTGEDCFEARDAMNFALRGAVLRALRALCTNDATASKASSRILDCAPAISALDALAARNDGPHSLKARSILEVIMDGPSVARESMDSIIAGLHSHTARVQLLAADGAAVLAEREPRRVMESGLLPRLLELLSSEACLSARDALHFSLRGALLRALRALCVRLRPAAERVLDSPSAIGALDAIAASSGDGPHAAKARAILEAVMAAPSRTVEDNPERIVTDLRSNNLRSRLMAADKASTYAERDGRALLKHGVLPCLLDILISDACFEARDALNFSLRGAVLRTLRALCTKASTSRAAAACILDCPSAVGALDALAARNEGAHALKASVILDAIIASENATVSHTTHSSASFSHHQNDEESTTGTGVVSPFTTTMQKQAGLQETSSLPAAGEEENPTPPRLYDPFRPVNSLSTDGSMHSEGAHSVHSARRTGFARQALLTRLMEQESQSNPSLDAVNDTDHDSIQQHYTDGELSEASLMSELSDWMLDASEIEFCRDKRGKPIKLGEGGFGVVYKAVQHGVDEVAVKKIRSLSPTPGQLRTFHYEVNILRRLCHRNIVQFYGACLQPESLFLVTELMAGGDLYSALRRHPELLQWDQLGKRVAKDVALGLHFLHTRKPPVLHRDLKSPNILLTGEGVAKIADVGMSRRMLSDLATAQSIMTPLWSAPEVLRRERTSVKADIWSYGVLIWEIVTGSDITQFPPLALTKGMPTAEPKTEKQNAPTVKIGEDTPTIARHIFEQCTQTSPALRPSALQIIEWLRDA